MAETSAPAQIDVPVDEIRLRPATTADVDGIFKLIDEVSKTTTVLPRTRENISEYVRDFTVGAYKDRILACGALNVSTKNLAEIKSLAVDARLRGQGIGGRLVQSLVAEARRLGIRRVFALTDNPRFLQSFGFRLTEKATLPHKVWNECIRCEKFNDCQEEAVDLILTPNAPAPTCTRGSGDQ